MPPRPTSSPATADDGVLIDGNNGSNGPTSGNVVAGNLIGLDQNAANALVGAGTSSTDGVFIRQGAQNNIIGINTAAADTASMPNTIGGNAGYGIQVDVATTTGNVVDGNNVGTVVNIVGALETTSGAPISLGGAFAGGVSTTGPVILVANFTVNAGGGSGVVTFGSTIDGAFSLTTQGSANTSFDGVIGGATPLASINANSDNASSLSFNTSAVTTTGAQSWLWGNSSSGFAMTVNSPSNLATFTSTASGNITFGQASSTSIRDVTAGHDALVVNTAGLTKFNARIGDNSQPFASITTDAPGSLILGVQVDTTGAMTFNDPTSFVGGGAITIASTSGGNIAFASTVNSNGTSQSPQITTAGTVTFGGNVGATNAFTNINVTAGGGASSGNINLGSGNLTLVETGSTQPSAASSAARAASSKSAPAPSPSAAPIPTAAPLPSRAASLASAPTTTSAPTRAAPRPATSSSTAARCKPHPASH